jgi:hypothetical protein
MNFTIKRDRDLMSIKARWFEGCSEIGDHKFRLSFVVQIRRSSNPSRPWSQFSLGAGSDSVQVIPSPRVSPRIKNAKELAPLQLHRQSFALKSLPHAWTLEKVSIIFIARNTPFALFYQFLTTLLGTQTSRLHSEPR